jgi:hypothetical protein
MRDRLLMMQLGRYCRANGGLDAGARAELRRERGPRVGARDRCGCDLCLGDRHRDRVSESCLPNGDADVHGSYVLQHGPGVRGCLVALEGRSTMADKRRHPWGRASVGGGLPRGSPCVVHTSATIRLTKGCVGLSLTTAPPYPWL